MLSLFDPIQYKHEPQFSLFSGSPKPNSEVPERAKILNEALLKQGHEIEAHLPTEWIQLIQYIIWII